MSARVLVLGGGGFLGYHAVTEALAAGHEVSVFSRSGRAPVEGVEVVTGDREGDLSALRGREWDAVFDTYNDRADGAPAIRATARLLSGSVGAYGYVSGMSVYAPMGPAVPDETGPVRARGVEPDTDRLQLRSLAKLAGEAAVTEEFDGVALFPRVGIMVGPRSTRMSYWPVRFASALAGETPRRVVLPGDPERPVQYSDARDIAAWCWRMLVDGRGGTYNTVGPCRPDPLRQVLLACLEAAGGGPDDVELVTARDEDALRAQLASVDEEERPLWYPEDQIPQVAIDSAKAAAAGLVFRSARETAADILRWAEEAGERPLLDRFVGQERLILERLAGRG
ncbi:2'-hydroxyisoflavone reductase [Friedmanniella endophytica]|uniref:2'-hydroxyisoflavone reductase n=1 Tax=Microlunatus kandeliicorticis TaxID=1759536 RepID=A0A7W3INY0_9ACTN|nr:NAD-dependent epimerase/dehydratase family protein [Microlunatus kandeliicorticis]MBA8792558.1 2'-hydroxyisoflavone reductase [Microlunatus kandeliicorticis]